MKATWLSAAATVFVLLAMPALAQQTYMTASTDPSAVVPGLEMTGPCAAAAPGAPDWPAAPGWREITQLPGWPKLMGANPNFKPRRGVVFLDLDGDGDLEIISASTDNKVYAWDYSGTPMPGFPVGTIGMCQYPPSVDDLDGDGDYEIVQATRGQTSGGRLYVLDHQGKVLPGFPLSLNNNNVEYSPTLYDLDGDGKLEIIVGERAYPIGYVHVVELDGTAWSGHWPVALDHVPAATAAVGDVNNDGTPEIFYQSYDSMYLLRVDGSNYPGWPRQIPNAKFSYQSAALADLDGDGDREIVVGAHGNAPGCYVFHHDGTAVTGWPKLLGTWTYCAPTVTDMEGDGLLDILDGRAGYVSGYSNCFWVWDATGKVRPGFPYASTFGGGSEGPLTVADINGDGLEEIFADFNMMSEGAGWQFGVDASGQDLPGFPLRPRGFTYMSSATIGDVNGDGHYELGVLSYHDAGVDVNLYTLPDTYAASPTDWKTYHARYRRGGLYAPQSAFEAGDLNCDGKIDAFDIDAFVLALTDAAGYAAKYPDCDLMLADINGDGKVDAFDIDPFVALLIGP